MKSRKEIKFSSLSFAEIGIEGIILHEYIWDDNSRTLTYLVDKVEIEILNEDDARSRIKQLITHKRKDKSKNNIIESDKTILTCDKQMSLF